MLKYVLHRVSPYTNHLCLMCQAWKFTSCANQYNIYHGILSRDVVVEYVVEILNQPNLEHILCLFHVIMWIIWCCILNQGQSYVKVGSKCIPSKLWLDVLQPNQASKIESITDHIAMFYYESNDFNDTSSQ